MDIENPTKNADVKKVEENKELDEKTPAEEKKGVAKNLINTGR